MMLTRNRNENFLVYFIFEILLVGISTFTIVAVYLLYFMGRADSRQGPEEHETSSFYSVLEHLSDYAVVPAFPALGAMLLIVLLRNRNYIVGYEFNREARRLDLVYRSAISKKLNEVSIAYDNMIVQTIQEKNFLFNESYRGKRFVLNNGALNIDFIVNNFIWEEHPRERLEFSEELQLVQQELEDLKKVEAKQ